MARLRGPTDQGRRGVVSGFAEGGEFRLEQIGPNFQIVGSASAIDRLLQFQLRVGAVTLIDLRPIVGCHHCRVERPEARSSSRHRLLVIPCPVHGRR